MKSKTVCPECNGRKFIVGHCECDMEWRTQDDQTGVDDCICEPDHACPVCEGTGVVKPV